MSSGTAFAICFKLPMSMGRSINLHVVAMMAQEDNKVEMEIFCKWNDNFCSDWL